MDWTKEEIDAAVVAYIEMKEKISRGEKIVKKNIYSNLAKKHNRSEKAFEYRMQNISFVYSLLGRDWIAGLNPAKNVGTNVIAIIEKCISENEKTTSTGVAEFENLVSKLRNSIDSIAPSGSLYPQKNEVKTVAYNRDPNIAAWLLKNSEGKCESCGNTSPFKKSDGLFYLEIHHLKRLADGGSDTLNNAIAVCPNCHREFHYGEDRGLKLRDAYKRIRRLSIE